MVRRIDKKTNKSRRILELFADIVEAKSWIPIARFSQDQWGDERTLRRMLNELNDFWSSAYGQDLFDVVDADGCPVIKGDRFIRRKDDRFNLEKTRAEHLAVYPAVISYLASLRGSIIADQLASHFSRFRELLSKKERTRLDRMSQKFSFSAKGSASYDDTIKSDVVDEVYEALLKETKLKLCAKNAATGEQTESVVRPLALVLHNTALYLVAQYDSQPNDRDAKLYHFRVDYLVDAQALRDERFQYPSWFDASKEFQGSFGIMSGMRQTRKSIDVEIRFKNDPHVKRYVRERRYTSHDRFEDHADGTLSLCFQVTELTEVVSWVLSFGASAEVIGPQTLRQLVSEELVGAANLYG